MDKRHLHGGNKEAFKEQSFGGGGVAAMSFRNRKKNQNMFSNVFPL